MTEDAWHGMRRGAERVLHAPRPRSAALLLGLLVALVVAAGAWAVIARVDVVAQAEGRILPDRRVQPVHATRQGRIDAVRVGEGEHVARGEVLLTVDREAAVAQRDRLVAELRDAKARRLRLVALLMEQAGLPPTPEDWRVEPEPPQLRAQAAFLATQQRVHAAAARELEAEHRRATAAEAVVEAELEAARGRLPYAERALERMRALQQDGFVPLAEVEDADLEVRAQRDELPALEVRLASRRAERQEIEASLAHHELEWTRRNREEEIDARQRVHTLREQLREAEVEVHRRTVRAPLDGKVVDRSVAGPGQFVGPGDDVLRIVPEEAPLEVEAFVRNRDIGHVRKGQGVSVKIETFEFTRYGSLPGRIVELARDASEHEELGPAYRTIIALERDWVRVDGERRRLLPGMAATVDLELGRRRVADYVLEPLLRYRDESLRER